MSVDFCLRHVAGAWKPCRSFKVGALSSTAEYCKLDLQDYLPPAADLLYAEARKPSGCWLLPARGLARPLTGQPLLQLLKGPPTFHTMSLVGNPLKQLWSAYERQLERRPVLTQMTTSAVLWGCGDILAQRLEYWEVQNERQQHLAAVAAASKAKLVKGVHRKAAETAGTDTSSDPQMVIAWKRAVLTGMFGALFVGPVGHYWYITLDRWCSKLVPRAGPVFIATKVAIDTAAMGPFYVSAFFAWGCAFMDGSSWNGFKRKMQVDFWPTLIAEASAWPAIQAVNFSVVPLKHQLLVVNLMTVLDACFMSWARNQDDWLTKVKQLVQARSSSSNEQQRSQGTLSMLPLKAENSSHGKKKL